MEQTLKYAWGGAAGILSLLAPTRTLIVCAVVFIGVDFLTGVVADRKRARLQRTPWAFRSDKAWDTVSKLGFVMAGIVLAHLIDCCVITFVRLNLANLFTGFVCGVEFWSYLENAAVISDHPVFRWLRRFMQTELNKALHARDGDAFRDAPGGDPGGAAAAADRSQSSGSNTSDVDSAAVESAPVDSNQVDSTSVDSTTLDSAAVGSAAAGSLLADSAADGAGGREDRTVAGVGK